MNHPQRPPNRLAHETSPYLLRHAQNPVDWYPWGEEAFARARAEDKPILVSIGYSACHWCHVMERESFDDASIARLMNEHFVCIKVDREERPDVDGIYMAATVALNGNGGWPMTVFLTPEREPFFAGTYFPPEERQGRPGFRTLLQRLSGLWKEERASLVRQARELTHAIQRPSPRSEEGRAGQTLIDRAIDRLRLSFDERCGGFGGAPKFPPHGALALLLRQFRRTKDPRASAMLRRTLDAMAAGGIHDHLGGGFARYATDAQWLVPHFEKMLADNAQLGRVYAEASVALNEPRYAAVARATLDFAIREMQGAHGGFYSALDADSEGEEGKYYVWSQDELVSELGSDSATQFSAYYGTSPRGNWEGKNILHAARALDEVAEELGVAPDELEETLARAREVLFEVRAERTRPEVDDQVLTAHCALMIGALAEASRLLSEPRYFGAAERAAQFVLREMRDNVGGVLRAWRSGVAKVPGFLDDHAYLADALVDLYEAGGEFAMLTTARGLAQRIIGEFADPDVGDFYTTTTGHDGLLFRAKEPHDGAFPSPTAVAARTLIRLGRHFEDPTLLAYAHRALRSQAELLERSPLAALTTLLTLDLALEPPVELVLVGNPSTDHYRSLARAVGREFLPSRVVVHHDPRTSSDESSPPIARDKTVVAGEATLYVCGQGACDAPRTTPESAAVAIRAAEASCARARGVSLGLPKLEGSATPQGTESWALRFAGALPSTAFATLAGGLRVSRLGIASRYPDGAPAEYRHTLETAIRLGMNLVDISAQVSGVEAEALVGEAIAELCSRGVCRRDELVLVTKVGPIRGRDLATLLGDRAAGRTTPRSLVIHESLEYSLDPRWLEQQLSCQLDRLGLRSVDGYLIHDPELLLTAPHSASAGPSAEAEEALCAALQAAFGHLETEVKRGRIRLYGIAMSSWRRGLAGAGGLALGRVLDAAVAAGGPEHHFRLLEAPLNLVEQGVLEPNRDDAKGPGSLLAEATARSISVLTTRPLIAHWNETTLRLRDRVETPGPQPADALAALATEERDFRQEFAPQLRFEGGAGSTSDLFDCHAELSRAFGERIPAEAVQTLYLQRIAPRVAAAVRAIDSAFGTTNGQAWQNWRDRYLTTLAKSVAALRYHADARAQTVVDALSAVLDEAKVAPQQVASLAQKALWLTNHLPGVSSTVVDWNVEADLTEGRHVLEWPAAVESAHTFDAVRRSFSRLQIAWDAEAPALGSRGTT